MRNTALMELAQHYINGNTQAYERVVKLIERKDTHKDNTHIRNKIRKEKSKEESK